MAKQVLTNAKVWYGGYDLSGDLNAIVLKTGVDAKDSSAIGDTARVFTPGLKRVDAQHEGFVNAGAGLSDAALFALIGAAATPMSIAPRSAGGVLGEHAYLFLASAASYTAGAPVGEMHRFSLAAEAGDGAALVRGTVLHNATVTATGVGDGWNVYALASGATLYATLHVLAVSGTNPTLDVTVESDTVGFPSPITRLTFAQAIAVGSQWAVPLAGPVTDTWWRVAYTVGGTGSPSFLFVVVLGLRSQS